MYYEKDRRIAMSKNFNEVSVYLNTDTYLKLTVVNQMTYPLQLKNVYTQNMKNVNLNQYEMVVLQTL